MSEIVTIGIKHHETLESFIRALLDNEVTHLMDTRYTRQLRNPLSPIFAVHKKLIPALSKVGILYSWRNSLGIPLQVREQWIPDKNNPPTQAELLELYRDKLLADGVLLAGLRDIPTHYKKTAIMCVCNLDKEVFCHRRLVAMLLDSPECKDLTS